MVVVLRRQGDAAEEYLTGLPPRERGRFARDAYSVLHFPIVLGIVLFAVAAGSVVADPEAVLPAYQRFSLAAGMGLVLLAMVAAAYRAVRRVPVERLTGGVVLFGLATAGVGLAAIWFAALSVGTVAAVLVVERLRHPGRLPAGAQP